MSKTTLMSSETNDTRVISRCSRGYDWNTINDGEYLYFGNDRSGVLNLGIASTHGLQIGKPWAGVSKTAYTGMKQNIADSWSSGAPVGLYFDDGGTVLTKWGECFTVGQAILTASTGGTQLGWPYTAFFYTDVEANITSATNQHWPTLMTSFIVGTGITFAGFTVGASSHHASVDVNGTLSSGSTLSCISFGGNRTGGTIQGGAFVTCLHVRANGLPFSAFLKLDDAIDGSYQASPAGSDVHEYLKVYIGSKLYTIAMDSAT